MEVLAFWTSDKNSKYTMFQLLFGSLYQVIHTEGTTYSRRHNFVESSKLFHSLPLCPTLEVSFTVSYRRYPGVEHSGQVPYLQYKGSVD